MPQPRRPQPLPAQKADRQRRQPARQTLVGRRQVETGADSIEKSLPGHHLAICQVVNLADGVGTLGRQEEGIHQVADVNRVHPPDVAAQVMDLACPQALDHHGHQGPVARAVDEPGTQGHGRKAVVAMILKHQLFRLRLRLRVTVDVLGGQRFALVGAVVMPRS